MGIKYAYVARAIDNPYVPPVDPPDPGNPPPIGEDIPGAEDSVYFARCNHTSPYTITVNTLGASNAQVVVGSSAVDRHRRQLTGRYHPQVRHTSSVLPPDIKTCGCTWMEYRP